MARITVTYNNQIILSKESAIPVDLYYGLQKLWSFTSTDEKILFCKNKVADNYIRVGHNVLDCKDKFLSDNITVSVDNTPYLKYHTLADDGVDPEYIETLTFGE